jgi:alpha-methylacyl-CoA racemase
LTGIRVIEMAGLGPAPFGCTILADLGADVIRVDRAGDTAWPPDDPMLRRGRRSIALDLKQSDHLEALLRLADGADVFVEGFRPGVAIPTPTPAPRQGAHTREILADLDQRLIERGM